jgi:phasin family protein
MLEPSRPRGVYLCVDHIAGPSARPFFNQQIMRFTMFSPFTPQMISPAIRSHMETMFTLYNDMAARSLDTMRSLTELNLQLARDLLAEAGANSQRLLSSKDASQLGAAVRTQMAPAGGALQTYQRRLAEIVSQGTSSMAQTAADHMPAVRRSTSAVAEEMVQQASEQTSRASEQMAQYHAGSQMRH